MAPSEEARPQTGEDARPAGLRSPGPLTRPLDKNSVDRGTKCFSPRTNGYPGGFPIGFLKWVRDEKQWWGRKRIWLCAGRIGDQDPDSVRVDIRPDVGASLVGDARNTGLPSESFDFVGIDPPYSQELAESMYGTGEVWSSIDKFAREGARLLVPSGLLLTLTYQIPKPPPQCDFIAVWGIYQTMSVSHMRCLAVARKRAAGGE